MRDQNEEEGIEKALFSDKAAAGSLRTGVRNSLPVIQIYPYSAFSLLLRSLAAGAAIWESEQDELLGGAADTFLQLWRLGFSGARQGGLSGRGQPADKGLLFGQLLAEDLQPVKPCLCAALIDCDGQRVVALCTAQYRDL
jgi:hypothetical protein